MFSFRGQKRVVGSQVGIGLRPDGCSLVHLATSAEQKPKLLVCEWLPADTASERSAALAKSVAKHGLKGTPCVVVLHYEQYSLRLVERPQVEDHELRDAARWLLADLVDFDLTDAGVEVFDFPHDARRSTLPTLHVAAARPSAIQEASELAAAAGLQLDAIDIPELAIRNAVALLPELVSGSAILTLGSKQSGLLVCHEDHLYLARSIAMTAEQVEEALAENPDEAGEYGPPRELEELLLQIQRSLDYYESELGKAPAGRLTISPSVADTESLAPRLAEQLRPMPVEALDLAALVESENPLSQTLQAHCLVAVGAALRGTQPQLINFHQTTVETGDRLTAAMLLRIVAAAALFLGVLHVSELWAAGQDAKALAVLSGEIDHAQAMLERFQKENPEPPTHDSLLAEIAVLRSERDALSELTRTLQSPEATGSLGFSRFFRGLARHPQEGLWLTRIRIHNGGSSLALSGHTLLPNLVPEMLSNLREESDFRGKGFRVFRMNVSETLPGVVDFVLESDELGGSG